MEISYQDLATIQNAIGYSFCRKYLLIQAFTRSSYGEENGVASNETLEFIGDRVLDYVVTKILVELVRKSNDYYYLELLYDLDESDLTEVKQFIVENETLAHIIDNLGFANYLLLGKGDRTNKVSYVMKVKADLYEAIIGAVAIDSNWNMSRVENVVRRTINIEGVLNNYINEQQEQELPDDFMDDVDMDNAINVIQELAQKDYCSMPIYKFSNEQVVQRDGSLVWQCMCKVSDWNISSTINATSKKVAKKVAAYDVLCKKFGIKNRYLKN